MEQCVACLIEVFHETSSSKSNIVFSACDGLLSVFVYLSFHSFND